METALAVILLLGIIVFLYKAFGPKTRPRQRQGDDTTAGSGFWFSFGGRTERNGRDNDGWSGSGDDGGGGGD
ncbi:MAG: hypothetical protein AAGH60_01670 [Pseudomonadota bacterium]